MNVCLLCFAVMANMSTKHLGEIEFSCLCFHNYFYHSMYPVNQITAIHHKRSAEPSTQKFANSKPALFVFTERSEMEWKEEHDVLLCREMLVSQPFKFKERTVERGKIWDEIADRLNNCQTLKFRVNKRSVRERFKLIKEKFKRKVQDEEKASGIDVEPASEHEQALEDICALEESLPAEVMDSKQAKAEANKLKAEEIRQKAMESFGQTKAREGQDEPAKKKRRGGNDSIQFLREKSEKELEVRKQELKLKEKEQEHLFEQQREMMRLMQSQQQSMMDLVSKLVNK